MSLQTEVIPQDIKPSPSDLQYRYHISSFCRHQSWKQFKFSIGEKEPDAIERLKANYFNVKEKVGGNIPTTADFDDKTISKYCQATYAYHYGNFTNFLISIGELPESATIYDNAIRSRRSTRMLAEYARRADLGEKRVIQNYLHAKKRYYPKPVPRSWYDHGPHGTINHHWGGWVAFVSEMEQGLPNKTLHCLDCKIEIIQAFSSHVVKMRCASCKKIIQSIRYHKYKEKIHQQQYQYSEKYGRLINPKEEHEINCGNPECGKLFLTKTLWQRGCCTKCYARMKYLGYPKVTCHGRKKTQRKGNSFLGERPSLC